MSFIDAYEKYWSENDPDMPTSPTALFQWFYEQGMADSAAEITRLKAENENIKEVEFPKRIEKVTAALKSQLQTAEQRVAREILTIMSGCDHLWEVEEEIKTKYKLEV